MKKFFILLIALCFVFVGIVRSQSNFSLQTMERVDIPFEYQNNLIIINVLFQGMVPLKFIFDTGAEYSILSKKEITDVLGIPYQREFKLIGSDMSTEITAYLISGIQLQISDLLLPNRAMLVLDEDHLHLESVTGVQMHGIIGSDIFKRYVVKIDYRKKMISLFQAETFKLPKKGFEEMDIEIYRNKPYIKDNIWFSPTDSLPVKLLIDTGAALSLLLHTNTDERLQVPEGAVLGKLAFGLGGFIEGHLGRIRRLELGVFELQEVLTNFQDLNINLDTTFLNSRNGVIGNQVLNRFDVIFHYPFQKLYLRPNKTYRKSFKFDKSGLVVIATGKGLDKFTVHDIIANSPAAEAGLQKGDVIKSINWTPTGLLSLKEISRVLKKKSGKHIRMVVKRDKKRLIFNFRLRKLV